MTAMLRCELLVNSMILGKLYAVLNKRNGRILKEEMRVRLKNFLCIVFTCPFVFVCRKGRICFQCTR
jgi:translation elongation factor EF-G